MNSNFPVSFIKILAFLPFKSFYILYLWKSSKASFSIVRMSTNRKVPIIDEGSYSNILAHSPPLGKMFQCYKYKFECRSENKNENSTSILESVLRTLGVKGMKVKTVINRK